MSTAVDPDELARLEEERAFLLRSLDDLEREYAAGDLDELDYRTLRDGYTARAAVVLRAIDAGRAAPAVAASEGGRRPRWVRVVAAVAVAGLLAGVAGAFVARSAGQRLPGGTLTGGNDAETVNADLARGRSLFGQGQLLDAVKAFDAALDLDPDNAEALTYRGWLLFLVGASSNPPQAQLVATGEASIDRAIAASPTYGDAQCFKAVIRFRGFGDAAGAAGPIAACTASNPPPEVRAQVEGLQAEVAAATSTTAAP